MIEQHKPRPVWDSYQDLPDMQIPWCSVKCQYYEVLSRGHQPSSESRCMFWESHRLYSPADHCTECEICLPAVALGMRG